MKKESILSAVVIIAEMHNPTILHPSFLSSEKIIPKDWHPIGDLLCTPGFSTVTFNNNYSFLIDHNRLEIKNNKPDHEIESSEVAEIAKKYISKLEYTKYLAVGINFMFFALNENPDKFIIDSYLSNKFRENYSDKSKKITMEFELSIDNYLLSLKFSSGEKRLKQKNEKQKGIVITSNIHKNLLSDDKLRESINILSDYKYLSDEVQKIISDFLLIGEKK